MNGILLVLLVYVMVWRPRPCHCLKQEEEGDLSIISEQVQYGVRSQRDLMINVTIDQLPMVSVSIYDSLFKNGRNDDNSALTGFMELMQHGVQGFTIDLEPRSNQWMLKESNVSFPKFLNIFQSYVNSTDNNLSANILVLLLRISPSNKNITTKRPTFNLTHVLDWNLGRDRIYAPDDLQSDRDNGQTFNTFGADSVGWPTLNTFLYDGRKRVVLIEITKSLVHRDTPYIFDGSPVLHLDQGNATLGFPTTIDEIQNLSTVSWRFLESSFTTSDIKEYLEIGYNPIITNKYNVDNFSDISQLLNTTLLWSWQPNQPRIIHTSRKARKHELVAYNCAVLHYTFSNFSVSWEVENCYKKHRGLCKSKFHDFTWVISRSRDNYFEFDKPSESKCPDDYYFSLPKTPLEQLAVVQYLKNISAEDALIWIDMNSVSVNDCWVTGGPQATCPYQRVVSKRNFVAMLTPVTVCSLVILCVVFYLNILRVPIHNNRKSWKRIVNEVSKWEVDGVPS